jgi:hypothetical protein
MHIPNKSWKSTSLCNARPSSDVCPQEYNEPDVKAGAVLPGPCETSLIAGDYVCIASWNIPIQSCHIECIYATHTETLDASFHCLLSSLNCTARECQYNIVPNPMSSIHSYHT